MVKTRRIMCVFLAAFVFTAVPAAAAAQDLLLSSYPEDGNLVLWGCAPRQSLRAREIDAALNDAAWKAALFQGVRAARTVILSGKNTFPDFSIGEQVKIVPACGGDFSIYKSALRYNAEELRVIGNCVFLRCVYPAKLDIVVKKTEAGKRPEWLKAAPQPGGIFALSRGFAGRRSYTSDAVAAAYENALTAMIVQKNMQIESRGLYSSAGRYATEIIESAAASVSSFFALEIFIDGATGGVWVLAGGK